MYVDYQALGRRIAARRKELGLKQFSVNEMAGLGDKYLSNIERATSVPSIDVLMKLCDILQTTPDYLLLGTSSDPNEKSNFVHMQNLLSRLDKKQLKLVFSFIEWIAEQKL